MTIEKTNTAYFKVILPLKLEWEPCYYMNCRVSGESGCDTAGHIEIGTRVKVLFAGKDYIGIISETDVIPDVDKTKIKQIVSIEDRLEKISEQEISLWRAVAEYYMCTIGEVYKSAYPAFRTKSEKSRALQEERKDRQLKKESESISKRIHAYKERIIRRKESLEKARKESVITRLKEEITRLDLEIQSLEHKLTIKSFTVNHPVGTSESYTLYTGISLSKAQHESVINIKKAFSIHKTALLKGVTGSGKTEIYICIAAEILNKGQNVLYLVPEIALSKQLEQRLKKVFDHRVLVFHSGETPTERASVIEKVRKMNASGTNYIILGTRSSIFLPHSNLGLIIVDEEHDISYKQDSPAPRYNGRDTAAMLASIHSCDLLLGSATPSLESIYNCKTGKYALISLNERYNGAPESDVILIDTSLERKKRGMRGSLSLKLIFEIKKTLDRKEQIMILRSRRSYSPIQQCSECGTISKCPKCNLPLSYHKASEKDTCHCCGFSRKHTGKCPTCGGSLTGIGTGTQKIEEEITALFPTARVARLDSDSAHNRHYESEIIRKFSSGEIDILIGTQMVAKGFDFSGLTLVAVIGSDSLLALQDFRADEKAMQLLEQFRGRCGRRDKKGLFIIQTAQPQHPVYTQITNTENTLPEEKLMAERKEFGYPPFHRLIDIIIKDNYKSRGEKMSRILSTRFAESGIDTTGPYLSRNSAALSIREEEVKKTISIWTVRLSLLKDKNLSKHKSLISNIVTNFEKERNYRGHIAADVDPS